MKRSSGILLPVSALPSPHSIGTLGQAAYDFADFLHAAQQRYWQMLPLGPTGYGDSPYQSFSAFAGNPYFIDLDFLVSDGLLMSDELPEEPDQLRCVDYGRLYETRLSLLSKAKARGWQRDREQVEAFQQENACWLPDYALFMACKRHFDMKPWTAWDTDIRQRNPAALEHYREALREDIELFIYVQYLFFRQWKQLREYVAALGIGIIGDVPIYVAADSADVWAEQSLFQLDSQGFPTAVSGVPPDAFSTDGQLWGNPLYRWEAMENDGFAWWCRRIESAAKLYDVIRIDHFRGLASYWSVPYGETTAKNGSWVSAPGLVLVQTLNKRFPQVEFIAEDLGILTPDVQELLYKSRWSGMKVLEFAFDAPDSPYLPHRYDHHCVCYTGTHDNPPLDLWRQESDRQIIERAERYFGLHESEGFAWGMIRGGMSSVADLFVMQAQDVLDLPYRTNVPSTCGGNWRWRLLQNELTDSLAKRLAEITVRYGRA